MTTQREADFLCFFEGLLVAGSVLPCGPNCSKMERKRDFKTQADKQCAGQVTVLTKVVVSLKVACSTALLQFRTAHFSRDQKCVLSLSPRTKKTE